MRNIRCIIYPPNIILSLYQILVLRTSFIEHMSRKLFHWDRKYFILLGSTHAFEGDMIQIENVSNEVIKGKFKLFVVERVNWNFEDAFTKNIVVDIYGRSFMINDIFGKQTRLQLKLGFNIFEGDVCNFIDILLPINYCICSIQDNCNMNKNSMIK